MNSLTFFWIGKDNFMKTMLKSALVFAAQKHDGQFDKEGNPYLLHVMKVMHYIKSSDEEILCIALLHDVIEDTDATYADLATIGMSERVIEGVRALTKVKGETYEEYKEKVKSNHDAIIVKMADLRHNSDIRRLKGVTDKDVKRIQKYHEFYLELIALG